MRASQTTSTASHQAKMRRGRELGSRPLRMSTAALGLAVLILFGLAARAEAGPSRYIFEKCDSVLPGGGVDGAIYGAHPRNLFSSENTCGQPGGALIVRQNEIAPGDGGSSSWAMRIAPPPGGSLESVTITAAACGTTEPSIYSLGWIAPPTKWPGTNCGQDVRSFRLVHDFEAFFIELRCVNYGQADNHCHAGPWVLGHYFATEVVDPEAPTLELPEGSMLSGGVKRGRQSVGVTASDVGGGLASISVSVNGLPAAQPKVFNCNVAQADNPSVLGTVAAQTTPCPTGGEANWTINTGSYPFRDGANSVMVCASDFSTLNDPNTTCSAPQTVVVDNSCTESAVPGGEVLSAQFERSHEEQVTVGFGKKAVVSGRLANNAGDPIRGATLCVKMATIGVDERAANVGLARTDANGRYSYEVPAGPNREVRVGYRHDSSQVAREVRYYAHARPRLRISKRRVHNGQRVRFWGRLPGPQNVGRVVILQAGTVGSKRWITFRKATAKSRGVFRANYRFSHTTRRTKYRFRAIVPRQAGYPWVAGRSRAVKVLVKPR